ncbi:hypothetical protein AB0N89_07965 [Amycolatopsis sp. NPDC089917]|uniref:hypothetical protein n=1 Tax=Amycolatopsis sp. NPDC089917 TaxID=3155187 RepID=UPI0034232491
MKPFHSRTLRRLVVVLAAFMASFALFATPSSAGELGAPRAAFHVVGRMVVNSPGAPVRCEVGFGNDVTVSGGALSVTWAVTCRWTDDGQLSTEVRDIIIQIAIRKNNRVIGTVLPCPPALSPSTTCTHRVPFDGTSGRYDSVIFARVTWNDGYPPISGLFGSDGTIIT